MFRSLFLLLFLTLNAAAQCSADRHAPKLPTPISVAVYRPGIPGGEVLSIPMDFAGSKADAVGLATKLRGATVARIDIVYTDYPKGADLTALNQRRLDELNALLPEVLAAPGVELRLIAQTACTDVATARALFHGVSIGYRPSLSAMDRKKEIARVRDLFKEPEKATKAPDPMTTHGPEVVESDVLFDTAITGYITVHRSPMVSIDRKGKLTWHDDEKIPLRNWLVVDSTIPQVMARNEWKDPVIAADLTGSMYPYTAQLVLWTKLASMRNGKKAWVFFNDGDMTPDNRKVIGKTGGVYAMATDDYKEVQELALKTMSGGCGGDGPENNIEALLIAQRDFPKGELIMVADNWAPIKDKELMDQVKRPVHVILCGVWGGINIDYLELARSTGGSVHTMEEDLQRLSELNEGETFTLNNFIFTIEKGRIVQIGVAPEERTLTTL